MTIYVVSKDGNFSASFTTRQAAENYLAKHALRSPGVRWTIDEYESDSSTPEK